MILTYLKSKKLFIFKCHFFDRKVAIDAGFTYNAKGKFYVTDDPDKAYLLKEYATPSLQKLFKKYERYVAKKIKDSSSVIINNFDIPKNNKTTKDYFDYQRAGIYFSKDKNTLIADEMGLGKCESVDNIVFTPFGRKRFGDLRVGDEVIGSDGQPIKVTGIFPQGIKPLYRVTFSDGYSLLCTKDHMWSVISSNNNDNENDKISYSKKYINLTVEQLLNKNNFIEQYNEEHNKYIKNIINTYYKYDNGNDKWQIPIVKPIEFYNKEILPIDPYILGIIIGRGHIDESGKISVTLHKNDFYEIFKDFNINEIKSKEKYLKTNLILNLKKELKMLGLNRKKEYEKFIPSIYKYASIKNRLSLIQGLMDSNGYIKISSNKLFLGIEFYTTSLNLANDIAEIIHSLGGIVKFKIKREFYKYKNKKRKKCLYKLTIKLPKEFIPFRLKRKIEMYHIPSNYSIKRYITNIKYEKNGEAMCISVDSEDKLYVSDHAIVTHNTVQAIGNINLKPNNFKKIIIICPNTVKENWKREIEEWTIHTNKSISISSGSRINEADIMIMNFEIFRNKVDKTTKNELKYNPSYTVLELAKKWKQIDLLIIDESHRLKSLKANTTKNILKLKKYAKHIIALTGTPILNKPEELWTTIKLLGYEKEFGGIKDAFVKRYCGATFNPRFNKMDYDMSKVDPKILKELQIKLRKTFMIRRLKSQVLNLPPKIRSIIPLEVPLDFIKNYSGLERITNDIAGILQNDDINVDLISGLKPNQIQELSNFRKDTGLAKVNLITEFVKDILSQDQKVVIFCHHKEVINAYKNKFPNSVVINGDIPQKHRQEIVDKFQNDPDTKVFIGNFDSAGVGITLTASNIVIMAELYWHPFIMLQAEDRCYRIGTSGTVNIYYMFASNTLDSYIGETVVRKLNLSQKILEAKHI